MIGQRLRAAALTAGGLGYSPIAPGTAGSLPPIALVMLMAGLGAHRLLIDGMLLLLCAAAVLICLRLGAWAERHFGGKDPQKVVADEVAGQCIALLLLPWRDPRPPGAPGAPAAADENAWLFNAGLAGAAFVLFRIADIIKPPPAQRMQRMPGGRGIVADDLVAGLYALLVIHAGVWLLVPR